MGRKSRTPKIVEINGIKLSLNDWSKKTGISAELIRRRLVKGWNPIDAVNTPKIRKQGGFELTVGKEVKTVMEWARISGVNQATIRTRLNDGWSAEKAIFTKVNRLPKPESEVNFLMDMFKKFLVSERMRGYRAVGKIYRRLQDEEHLKVA